MTRDNNEPKHSPLRAVLQRLMTMGLAWMLMGLLLGMVAGRGSGLIGFVAALTAGAVVLTPVGLLLGLIGARASESLIGGILGLAVGVGAALLLGQPNPRDLAAAGLTTGAVIGATVVAAFYRLPRLIAGRLSARFGALASAN